MWFSSQLVDVLFDLIKNKIGIDWINANKKFHIISNLCSVCVSSLPYY